MLGWFDSIFDEFWKSSHEFAKELQQFFDTLGNYPPERWRPRLWHLIWRWNARGLEIPDESRYELEDLLRSLAPPGWVENYYARAWQRIEQQEAANRLNAAPTGVITQAGNPNLYPTSQPQTANGAKLSVQAVDEKSFVDKATVSEPRDQEHTDNVAGQDTRTTPQNLHSLSPVASDAAAFVQTGDELAYLDESLMAQSATGAASGDASDDQEDSAEVSGDGGAEVLHWIPFERYLENDGVLTYKALDGYWYRVAPAVKIRFQGEEVWDLGGAERLELSYLQRSILEAGGLIDDDGWSIILDHYIEQYGDVERQLLKDLASDDAVPALRKFAKDHGRELLISLLVGRALKSVTKYVGRGLGKIKDRLEVIARRTRKRRQLTEKELQEIIDATEEIGKNSTNADTKAAAKEFADELKAEYEKTSKEIGTLEGSPEKLNAPSNVAGEAGLGRIFAATRERATKFLGAGEGITDKWGNVRYSLLGSADDIALARNHEAVHWFLSPKFTVLRELRADIRMAGYQKSALLRYTEEALAETYAQLRVNGIKGTLTGITFPIKNGYVTVSQLAKEGAIGAVVVGGVTYSIYAFLNDE